MFPTPPRSTFSAAAAPTMRISFPDSAELHHRSPAQCVAQSHIHAESPCLQVSAAPSGPASPAKGQVLSVSYPVLCYGHISMPRFCGNATENRSFSELSDRGSGQTAIFTFVRNCQPDNRGEYQTGVVA